MMNRPPTDWDAPAFAVEDGNAGLRLHTGEVVRWQEIAAGRYQIGPAVPGRYVVVLARVSSLRQVQHGDSLHQQVQRAVQLAARRGEVITYAYLDPSKSATYLPFAKRPGISRLLPDIRNGKIGVIYGYKRDRIARDLPEWFQLIKLCTRYHVAIRFTCPQEPPLGQGAYAQFQEAVLMGAARLEADVTGQRLKDVRIAVLKRGRYPGGWLPYGLRRLPSGRIELIPDEAAIVRRIFGMMADERLGLRRITRALNLNYPQSRRGKEWTQYWVLRVLQNRTYCGYFHLTSRSGKREYQEQRSDLLPVIIPEEKWNQAATLRAERRRPPKPDLRYGACVRLLTGLAVCWRCGRPLHTRTGWRARQQGGTRVERHWSEYLCRYRTAENGCTNSTILRSAQVDPAVIQAVDEQMRRIDVPAIQLHLQMLRQRRRTELEAERRNLQRELAQMKADLDRGQAALETQADVADVQRLRAALRGLIAQKGSLEERLRAVQAEAVALEAPSMEEKTLELARAWPQDFGALPQDRQRELLGGIVERVVLGDAEGGMDIAFRFPLGIEDDHGEADRWLRSVPIPGFRRRRRVDSGPTIR